jgi:hypothetical protein
VNEQHCLVWCNDVTCHNFFRGLNVVEHFAAGGGGVGRLDGCCAVTHEWDVVKVRGFVFFGGDTNAHKNAHGFYYGFDLEEASCVGTLWRGMDGWGLPLV